MKFQEILIATNNKNKVDELSILFKHFFSERVKLFTPKDFGIESPAEDKDTFEGNANIKSMFYFKETGLPVISDDTGVCIHELKGMPGVYTADWACHTKNFKVAFERVKSELAMIGSKTTAPAATAVCVLSYMDGNATNPLTFRGELEGVIDFKFDTGADSFGFQPIFVPQPFKVPYSQLNEYQKFKVSHRARAFRKFVKYLSLGDITKQY